MLGLSRPDARRRAGELLGQFGLADAAARAARTYSGGMRRRLDLAASLVGRPRILFLDEPTTGLDPRSRGELWDVLRALVWEDAVTVLLTTQYLEEADQLAGEIVVIDQGRVVGRGTPDELKAQVGGQVLRVRPLAGAHLPTVFGVLRELTGIAPELDGAGAASIPVDDPALAAVVMRRLDDAGVLLAELTLRTSTLDEVFFALTGHASMPPGGMAQTPESEPPASVPVLD